MDPVTNTVNPSNVTPGENKPSNRNFILFFGIALFILVIVLALLGVGFYLGSHYKVKIIPESSVSTQNLAVQPTLTAILIPTDRAVASPTLQVQGLPSSAPSLSQGKTLTYQIDTVGYSLTVPEGWVLTKEKEDFSYAVRISKGEAALIIRGLEATEGVPCGFPDARITPSEMHPDVSYYTYDSYTEFKGKKGQLYRRFDNTANPSAGKSFFAICQKNDFGWMQPTAFGFIMYEVPYSDNPEVKEAETLKVLDGIFSSLQLN